MADNKMTDVENDDLLVGSPEIGKRVFRVKDIKAELQLMKDQYENLEQRAKHCEEELEAAKQQIQQQDVKYDALEKELRKLVRAINHLKNNSNANTEPVWYQYQDIFDYDSASLPDSDADGFDYGSHTPPPPEMD